MTKLGWDALAKWRDSRMGEAGDLWHRALIDPALLAMLGSVRGQRILEVGCGNGYLTRRFRRRGAVRAVGVDTSLASIRFARQREAARPSGAEFVHGNAARLPQFDSETFDRVVANMSLMDIRDAAATIREASRLLKPSGRFVFSINHPCFEIDENSSWLVEHGPHRETISRKVEGYRNERPVRAAWRVSETEWGYTTSYHRTLTTYAQHLYDGGLAISRLAEPVPRPELVRKSHQGRYIAAIPLHLVVEAVPWNKRALPRGRGPRRRRRKGTEHAEGAADKATTAGGSG
ncbi:MAG: class I SAM-dependent methyltransferase [Thermoplasmata archaeon]